jgi:DNA recombination protein RmuC
MIEISSLSVFFLIVLGVFLFFWFLISREIRSLKEKNQGDSFWQIMHQKVEVLGQELFQAQQTLNERYAKLERELGVLQELGSQMRGLQEFLQSPKLRGNLGEQVLQDLLEQVFPKNHFNLQHKFRSGEVVDAILKTSQGLIAIDSKFPRESFVRLMKAGEKEKEGALRDFKRDIKRHIDDVAKKYILPEEKTVDFALIYLPSEAVYYEIIVRQPELLEYGYQKRVYFVSPNTFYYFLKIIMVGLEGAKIEEASRKIIASLKAIERESQRFGEELRVLNNHLVNAKSAMDRVQVRYEKLLGKIEVAGELEAPAQDNKIQN